MNSLIDNDDEFARSDRELTLSTGAILGIFLGLVLLCGFFFGFGYKMGSHKAAPAAEIDTSSTAAPAPAADFNSFKPAAGSATTGSPSKETAAAAANNPPGSAAATLPHSTLATGPAPAAPGNSATDAHPATPTAPNSAAAPPGNFVVQVAAVTLQEDADLLAGALRSKGYTVTAHAQPDKLIHIQVGPFSNRKDADAMRQRLLADGYNAIVK